jgi:hypothetical protein
MEKIRIWVKHPGSATLEKYQSYKSLQPKISQSSLDGVIQGKSHVSDNIKMLIPVLWILIQYFVESVDRDPGIKKNQKKIMKKFHTKVWMGLWRTKGNSWQ